MIIRFNLRFLLFVLFLCTGFAAAQEETLPNSVRVQIHIFSGVPDPIMTLEGSEIGVYRSFLDQFEAIGEDEEERQSVNSFYRGLTIREYGPHKTPISDIVLYGKRILSDPQPTKHGIPLYRVQKLAPDDSLERYLLGLARDKGVIDEEVYQVALQGISMRK